MPEYTDEVSVLVGDLEMIQAALMNASGLATTHDLQYQFMQGRQRTKSSPLTNQLNLALDRVTGYLAEDENV